MSLRGKGGKVVVVCSIIAFVVVNVAKHVANTNKFRIPNEIDLNVVSDTTEYFIQVGSSRVSIVYCSFYI